MPKGGRCAGWLQWMLHREPLPAARVGARPVPTPGLLRRPPSLPPHLFQLLQIPAEPLVVHAQIVNDLQARQVGQGRRAGGAGRQVRGGVG
jgi:hypothetical protein